MKLTTCSGLPVNFSRSSRVLRGDADRAGVQVADAHHDAARARPAARWRSRTPRRRAARRSTTSRPVFSWPSVSTTMRLRRLLSTSVWCVSARPSSQGRPACLMRGLRRSAGAAVVAADQHDVGVRLGHAGGDRADADLGHQLDADARVRGWRSSGRGSARPGPRSSRCRGAAAARSGRRPASSGAPWRSRDRPCVPGSWPPSPGLAPWAILICSLAGVDQVVAGHAEAAGGHLLDGAVLRVAVRQRHVAGRVLAAFAGVALAADAVHGDGQRLVRFLADRAVATWRRS